MAESQQLIENIRAVLSSTGSVPAATVGNLAAAYASLCAETDARLRRCIDCLRQGLRSETVQFAETSPNLLETAAALDFPEREQWESLCERNHLPLAQPLRLEAAQEVNESYAAEAELHDLLARHRALALARAPLRERAAALRELARRDPVNPCWGREQRLFETARLVEIRDEAIKTLRSHDSGRAENLLDELEDAGWSVPSRIGSAALGEAAAAKQAAEAAEQLRSLVPLMEQAAVEQNFEDALALRARSQALTEMPHVAVPVDVAARAQPMLDWVLAESHRRRDQRKLDIACAPLRDALAERAPKVMLERLHADAVAIGLPLPPDLASSFSAAMAAYERAARRLRLINRTVLVSAGLLVVGVASGMTYQSIRSQREERWRNDLSHAISTQDLAHAQDLIQDMTARDPQVGDRPGFRELFSQVTVGIEAERNRVHDFHQHLETATSLGSTRSAPELAAAEQAARTPEEHAEAAAVGAHLYEAGARVRTENERAFRGQLAFLVSEIAALDDKLLADDPDAFARRLQADEAAASKLRASAGSVDEQVMAGVKPLEDRLAAARQAMGRAAGERVDFADVRRAIDSAPSFVAAMKLYEKHFPDSPRGRAFGEAVVQGPAWEAVDAWAAIVAGWSGVFVPASSDDALQRIATLSDYTRLHPKSPISENVGTYLDYLTQLRDVTAPGAAWKQTVSGLMQNPLIQDVSALRSTRGIYYFKGDPQVSIKHTSLGATFPAILTNDSANQTPVTLKEADIVGPPIVSPQSVLAKAVLGQLESETFKDWETAPLALAAMVREQKDLDPVLRAVMLMEVLKAGQNGGWHLAEPLSGPVAKLGALDAQKVVWVNPNDEPAKAARPLAAEGVKALPPLADIAAQVLAARDKMFLSLQPGVAGEAALFRTSGGWQLETRRTPVDGESAAIIVGFELDHPEWRTVAKVQGGKWVLDEEALKLVPEGSMAFIRGAKVP